MRSTDEKISFTGEFFVPGATNDRIEADHMARYKFAAGYARGKKVLDIACGFGYGGKVLAAAGAFFYQGVDINSKLIDNAINLYGSEIIKYTHADACSYKSDEKFDLIISFETIEHIENYASALRAMQNNLAPNGTIIISSPNRPITSPRAKKLDDRPENEYHTQEFTVNELKKEMHDAGFNMSNAKAFGQRLSLFNFNNRYLQKLVRYAGLNPSMKANPEVKKYWLRTPRYFVILAENAK
jgi:SAM-dependent methyltransferase